MTPIMKRTENKENAVSPVVGVMLMLVVTIIIAAVVAMFATGVATDVSTAPNAVLDVHIYSKKPVIMGAGDAQSAWYAPDLVIKHLGGDDLNTGNLYLTFSWNKDEKPYRTVYDGSAIGSNPDVTVEYTVENSSTSDSSTSSTYTYTGPSALYMNDGQNYAFDWDTATSKYVSDQGVFFGYVTLKSGYQLQSLSNYQMRGVEHKGSPAMDAVFGSGLIAKESEATDSNYDYVRSTKGSDNVYSEGVMALLPKGTSVHVVITDLKSNTAIFDKEVAVE